jgi:hypothetical protein
MLTVLVVVFVVCTVGRGVVVDIFTPNGTILTVVLIVDDDTVVVSSAVTWPCGCTLPQLRSKSRTVMR